MIKTLARSLRQHKKGSLFTILLSILEVLFDILIPLCMSNLIDFGVEQGSMGAVWKYGFLLAVCAILQLTTGVLSARLCAKASAGFAANLRRDLYANVQTFSFSNIDKFSTASIVTRLTTDVTNIQNAYQMLIRMAIRGPVMMLFAVIVSFRIHKQISLVFLIVIPVMAVLLVWIIAQVNPVFSNVFRTYDRLNNVVQEALDSGFDLEQVRACGLCQTLRGLFRHAAGRKIGYQFLAHFNCPPTCCIFITVFCL